MTNRMWPLPQTPSHVITEIQKCSPCRPPPVCGRPEPLLLSGTHQLYLGPKRWVLVTGFLKVRWYAYYFQCIFMYEEIFLEARNV